MRKDRFFLFAVSWIITLLIGACAPAVTATPTVTVTITTTPSPVPTETPIPTATKTMLNVSPDVQKALEDQKALNADGKIIDKLAHSDATTNVIIFPESIKVLPGNNSAVSEIIVGQGGDNQRYIWNVEIISWVHEYQFAQTYEAAQSVELSAVYDGSVKLDSLLYYAENPGIIPTTAAEPHYMFNFASGELDISPTRRNQHQWPDANDPSKHTIITNATIDQTRTWGWLDELRTTDAQGNQIVLFRQIWKNPTSTDSQNVLPLTFGVSQEVYDQYATQIGQDGLNVWERMKQTNNLQLLIALPYPSTFLEEPQGANFRFLANPSMPSVGRLLQGRNIYGVFSPTVLSQLESTYSTFLAADNKFSSPETPFSFPTGTLPAALSDFILFPGIEDVIGN